MQNNAFKNLAEIKPCKIANFSLQLLKPLLALALRHLKTLQLQNAARFVARSLKPLSYKAFRHFKTLHADPIYKYMAGCSHRHFIYRVLNVGGCVFNGSIFLTKTQEAHQ